MRYEQTAVDHDTTRDDNYEEALHPRKEKLVGPTSILHVSLSSSDDLRTRARPSVGSLSLLGHEGRDHFLSKKRLWSNVGSLAIKITF